MTFFTDVRTRRTSIDELPTSLSGSLGAAADIALEESPISSARRLNELDEALNGPQIPETAAERRGFVPPPEERQQRTGPDSPVLPAEEARKRIADEGLDLNVPDEGYPERALDILMERARERRVREDKFARAPQGVGPTALRLATSVAASLLDPVNIGLSFIPVVGPTKTAAMLARAQGPLGRAGVRAGVGTVEGTVGTALVEPLIFAARSQEQADFELQDALLDIALGGALGGGLHVVGGGAVDIVTGRRRSQAAQQSGVSRLLDEAEPETREAALRTAVAQTVEGKAVDVEALVRLDPAVREGGASPPETRVQVEQPRLADTPPFEPASPRNQATVTPTEIVDRAPPERAPGDLVQDLATVMRRELAKTRPAKTRQPIGLVRFLASEGGLAYSPELKKLGLENVFVPGSGRLVRKGGGRSLDYAREVAAEHGYMHRFGSPDDASSNTTISDLLDLLDEDHRSGGRVVSTDDLDLVEGQAALDAYDDQVRALDDALSEIDEALSNDIPLEIKRRAVELRLEEGLEPFDAIERAIIEDQYANGTPEPVLRGDEQEIEVPFYDPVDAAGNAGQRGPLSEGGPETQERAARDAGARGQAFRGAGRADREGFQEIHRLARTDQQSAIANPNAARVAEEKFSKAKPESDIKALQSETDDIIAEAQETADALDLGEEYAAELKAADQTDDAQVYSRAVRALASCQLRRGS